QHRPHRGLYRGPLPHGQDHVPTLPIRRIEQSLFHLARNFVRERSQRDDTLTAWSDHRLRTSSMSQSFQELGLVVLTDRGNPTRAALTKPLHVVSARVH